MPYENYWSARINDPKKYDRFTTKKIEGKDMFLTLGWKGDKSEVQAMKFDKDKFKSKADVESYMKSHDHEYMFIESVFDFGTSINETISDQELMAMFRQAKEKQDIYGSEPTMAAAIQKIEKLNKNYKDKYVVQKSNDGYYLIVKLDFAKKSGKPYLVSDGISMPKWIKENKGENMSFANWLHRLNEKKTKDQLIKEIEASKSEYITYGGDGKPVKRKDAIKDIKSMDDDIIGDGDWEECDEHGNVK